MATIQSKYQKVFEQFSPAPSEEELKQRIDELIKKNYDQINTKDNIKLLHSCVDLTSLSATDDVDSIYNFVKQVNDLDDSHPNIPPVAAICVYPNFVKIVKENLMVEETKIACVSGAFPSSQTFMEVKVVETGLAISDGADEVDIVLHVGNFLAGNYDEVADEITELRSVCRKQKLKVIIESGALKKPENIRRASILALYCGADFIKTSTGKEYPGASLEAAYIMATVLKEHYNKYGKRYGLKVSGGVRSTEEALQYLCIVKEVLGEEWMNNELFRIGASSLVNDLYKYIK